MANRITLYRKRLVNPADYPSIAWLKEKRKEFAKDLKALLKHIHHTTVPASGSPDRFLVMWIDTANLVENDKNKNRYPEAFGLPPRRNSKLEPEWLP